MSGIHLLNSIWSHICSVNSIKTDLPACLLLKVRFKSNYSRTGLYLNPDVCLQTKIKYKKIFCVLQVLNEIHFLKSSSHSNPDSHYLYTESKYQNWSNTSYLLEYKTGNNWHILEQNRQKDRTHYMAAGGIISCWTWGFSGVTCALEIS